MITKIWEWIGDRIFSPPSLFKKDDSVQHIRGGPLMIVLKIKREKKVSSTIQCVWFDREKQAVRKDSFREEDLKMFDWYNPSS